MLTPPYWGGTTIRYSAFSKVSKKFKIFMKFIIIRQVSEDFRDFSIIRQVSADFSGFQIFQRISADSSTFIIIHHYSSLFIIIQHYSAENNLVVPPQDGLGRPTKFKLRIDVRTPPVIANPTISENRRPKFGNLNAKSLMDNPRGRPKSAKSSEPPLS